MKTTTLAVRDIRCNGNHGCLEEEAKIGGEYTVDVEFSADISVACKNDTLQNTIDYVKVHSIVAREMAIRSKLIEHVAWRMVTAMAAEFPFANEIRVHLTKHRPPVNHGYLGRATVTLSSLDITKVR